MWLIAAILSSFFAGITSVLAKVRDQKNRFRHCDDASDNRGFDLSWLMVLAVGSGGTITQSQPKSSLFLILSGGAAGASWPSLFRAILTGLVSYLGIVNISSRNKRRQHPG